MKYKGLILLLTGLVMATTSGDTFAADEPLAVITVSAGQHMRIDTPVSVRVESLSDRLAQGDFHLLEVTDSDAKCVPCQPDPVDSAKLWWVLSGTTPAGGKRIYHLHKGPAEQAPIPQQCSGMEMNNSFLQINAGGRRVLRYHHRPVPPPEGASKLYTRSGFIHPLWSVEGDVLTNIHPPDHIHHVGIWMPWTKTEFEGRDVDFWNLGKGQGTVQFQEYLSVSDGPVFAGFRAKQEHIDLSCPGGGKVALNEVWDVRIYNVGGPGAGYWLWDLTSTQRCASDSPLHLPEYRYGGFGFRGPARWSGDDCAYLTSEGENRKEGHGKRLRWCDMSGAGEQGWTGVSIMSSPENFRHPEPVRIWPEGDVFFGWAVSQAGDWTMEPGRDYVFRYRFYVHGDKVDVEKVERFWRDFAKPPTVTVSIPESR